MKDLSEFLGTMLIYFVLAYLLICILLSVGCAAPTDAPLTWGDPHASFRKYMDSGEYHRTRKLRREVWKSCVVEMFAGGPSCGEFP